MRLIDCTADNRRHAAMTHDISDLEIGKAAEHLVVADLILAGYRAYLTDQGLPYDVILDDGGMFYRVQVKATRALRSVPQRAVHTPGYFFHVKRAGKGGRRSYAEADFDLFALVALDIRAIAYMPFSAAPSNCILLRPPGHIPANNCARAENIDGFPLGRALDAVKAKTTGQAATLEGDGRTFAELMAERLPPGSVKAKALEPKKKSA